MADPANTAEAPAKQSYLETQLTEAVTPPSERAKLNAAFESACQEWDAQGEAPAEPVKAQPEPAAVEATPVAQPRANIALQPTPRPADPDPMDEQARRMEVGAYIARHPDYKRETATTQRAYEDVVREMSQHFNSDAAEVKKQFTDPLLSGDYTPEHLTDEWFAEQEKLMTNASEITKRKIELKFMAMKEAAERRNKKAEELAQTYDNDQQQRAARNWEALIRAEATNALDEERTFESIKNLRDRANSGDQRAKAEFDSLENNIFRPFMVDLMTKNPNMAPGAATRQALRAVRDHMQGRGRKQVTSTASASQPSRSSPSSSTTPHTPLPRDARKSLDSAFDRWTPPEREGGYYWDAKTNSYKGRG